MAPARRCRVRHRGIARSPAFAECAVDAVGSASSPPPEPRRIDSNMEETAAQIESAIAALEAQRALLGDSVVEIAVSPLKEKLAARRGSDSSAQQLKNATVLFTDIVGSTHASERLDPEDIHAVMNSALERLTGIV